MKLKFKNQDFQTAAVVGLFKGQAAGRISSPLSTRCRPLLTDYLRGTVLRGLRGQEQCEVDAEG